MRDIWEESDDHGMCRFAMVQTYGDTTHTFIERQNYKGIFLPGYQKPRQKVERQMNNLGAWQGFENQNLHILPQDNLLAQLPPGGVLYIDHIVGNQPDLTMEDAAKW